MPTPYPKEFRDDVIRIALDCGPETTLPQIARDFGIHEGQGIGRHRPWQKSVHDKSWRDRF